MCVNNSQSHERRRQDSERQADKDAKVTEYNRKMEDWRDTKAYQAAQREAQRKSLAGRIAASHQEQQMDLERHQAMLDAVHMDFELRRLDHLEMREYRDEERVRGRRSIALRLASWKDDKMRKEKERAKEHMEKCEDAVLREQDREDLHAAKLALTMMERHNMISSV